MPTTPAPSTTTLAGSTPGTPPMSTPRPPFGFCRYAAPTCVAMRPATSDIGASSGSVRFGSSTVSYAMQTAPEATQALGLREVGSEVQVRVEDLARAQHRDLDRLRLLDLDDHVRAREDLVGGVDELGAGGRVLGIGERRAVAGALLDEHRVAVRDELPRRRRRHADTELVVLDLLGHSDDHVRLPSQSRLLTVVHGPPTAVAAADPASVARQHAQRAKCIPRRRSIRRLAPRATFAMQSRRPRTPPRRTRGRRPGRVPSS